MEWRSMLSSTVPSEWARNLVRGAYDLHVHVAPDVMCRRVTDGQLALARQGVFLERCFCPPYTGMCDWARMVANIRATGPATAIVTTDLGQPDNPPVEDGLALMADACTPRVSPMRRSPP